MTHSGGKPHSNIGDRGQRYVVVQVRHDRTVHTVGWTNAEDGGELALGFTCHPLTARVQVRDRQCNDIVVNEYKAASHA